MERRKDLFPPKLILLDVYETILSMAEIERRINHLTNSKRGYTLWFELFMQYTFADNCMEQFHDFSSIADATLRMSSRMLGRNIDTDHINEILDLMKHLPVQEGVPEGLSALYEQNYRIAALTNSPEKIVGDKMERTGLISYFEKLLSAEQVKKYKPALKVYKWAAEKLDLSPNQILLVSAHGWDIAGAENAGMKTAYIRQNKQMLYPLAPVPDLICNSLPDLSDQLSQLNTRL
ncbi:MAG TPA: haloacid dehalogenase type II [Chitinophagaceae bacterium]|nr:haloacid dehalogenase type II [Chitinophagaceae bacterium]